jgi:hypothetical protein
VAAADANAPAAVTAHFDVASVRGADSDSLVSAAAYALANDPKEAKDLLKTLSKTMAPDPRTRDNAGLCVLELAGLMHACIEIDFGVKVAVAIMPPRLGATRRIRLVHTNKGWHQAAPRGSAMYGAFDGSAVSRRPLDSVMILDAQRVSGGHAPSLAMVCESASSIPRANYRHKCRGRTLAASVFEDAISVHGPSNMHCLEFLCRSWTGRKAASQFTSWAAELSHWCKYHTPYAADGDNRKLHQVLSDAYGVSFLQTVA